MKRTVGIGLCVAAGLLAAGCMGASRYAALEAQPAGFREDMGIDWDLGPEGGTLHAVRVGHPTVSGGGADVTPILYNRSIPAGGMFRLASPSLTGPEESPEPFRKLVWKASLTLEVKDAAKAAERAGQIVAEAAGHVESRSDYSKESANLVLRLPADALQDVLKRLEDLGTVEYREVSSKDVTELYIDLEARLKNLRALRDRLRALLEQAKEVQEVLAIEKELSRVQADLDSLEGKLKALKGQVERARIDLRLHRRPILGPLGYAFKGLWWGIEKLFVIRE